MASIRLERLRKVYPNGHEACRDLSLEVADGELMVLVGPSGCGKSTALRMVAGLEAPTAGRIFLGEHDVTAASPQDRDLAMVFQSYALYPHMLVRDNLAFGLRMRKTPAAEIERRVAGAAAALDLTGVLDRRPAQLSGGQRQRVALGRAIVREPKAFLLDEPLSNLDARLRVQTRAELARLHRRLRATMLHVTHDQEEAMTLGNRVAVLDAGRLQQVAPPLEVYRRPANVFVAGFIGSPAMNLVRCRVAREGDTTWIENPHFRVKAPLPPGDRRDVILGIRPHDVAVGDRPGAHATARADVIQPVGSETLVQFELRGGDAATRITAAVPPAAELALDDEVGLRFELGRIHVFDAETGARIDLPDGPPGS